MPTAILIQRAQLAPGACFLSGDPNGPFIDTGKDIRGIGRIYLGVKHVGALMREAGWLPQSEVQVELDLLDSVREEDSTRDAEAEKYHALVEAILPLLPEVPKRTVTVAAFKDERIGEENRALKRQVRDLKAQVGRLQAEAAQRPPTPPDPAPQDEDAPQGGGPASVVTIADQDVDLDALLSHNVNDIKAVAEDWPVEVRAALAVREVDLAAEQERDPRKTVLALVEEVPA